MRFRASKTGLSPQYFFLTDRSKAILLLQIFSLSASVLSYVPFVLSFLFLISLILVPQEDCASLMWRFFGISTYIFLI